MKERLKMKHLVLFFLLGFVCISHIYAQKQTVTVHMKNGTLSELFSAIEKQTTYHFSYRDVIIDNRKDVTISQTDVPVSVILNAVLTNRNLVYTIISSQSIVISDKEAKAKRDNSRETLRKITGIVKDEKGQPLPGVTVMIQGTKTGTITDANGNYTLQNVAPNLTLEFSFVGMQKSMILVGDRSVINVTMTEATTGLNEIVVVGYGTQKKATLTGSVTSVGGNDIEETPTMNVTNALAGKVPGLVVVGQSGEPGADYSDLYIRGRSSLNDNSPLIVVDGIPNRSLERIDPSTIESVTVLKDASAAIYGSQAANGVILVTTKRGKAEKLTYSVNIDQGWSQPTKIPKMCNATEFATLVNEVDAYSGQAATYSATDIQKYSNGSDPWGHPNTKWFNALLKTWSPQTTANLSLTGGSRSLRVFASLSARSQDGFFKRGISNYKQYDLRSNIDATLSKYVTARIDFSGRLEDANAPTSSSASIFESIVTANPTKPAYWPNGLPGPPLDLVSQSNPVIQATSASGYNNSQNYVLNVDGKLNIQIPYVNGLSLTFTGSVDRGLDYTKDFTTPYTLYSWDGTTVNSSGIPVLNSALYGGNAKLTQGLNYSQQYLVNGLINYKADIAKHHNIGALVGVEAIENTSNWFTAARYNFSTTYPAELNFGDPNQQYANGANPGMNRWMNYFGRLNYAYDNKYLAEFVWRYQGSSKFSQKVRWGFFPGVSLGYRISEEKFWNDNIKKIINDLKIRASWGKTGNDLINPYQFYSLYSTYWRNFVTSDGTNHTTITESLAANVLAQWEVATQSDVGIDMYMFNSKISLTCDYFNNLRSKILIPQTSSVPGSTGLTGILPDVNIGKVRNQGVDFDITYADHINDFKFRIGLNGCYAKNKVLFFDEAPGAPAWQIQTGHPMYSGLYYKAIGIFHTQAEVDKYPHMDGARPGDIIFADINGDGKINALDEVRIYKSSVPTLTGGVNLYGEYKNFDLNVFIQGQAGAVRYVQPTGSTEFNYLQSTYDNRWTTNNPNSNYPRTFNRNNEYWMNSNNPSTFWLKKTDFIRLKSIELGYNIPKKYLDKTGINLLRLYLNAVNLFCYSPDMKDFDPEMVYQNDGLVGEGYPLQRIVNIGCSINF
ncbi:SusC/RagA family TonB-linked outer membrane protein [Microbacter margulisiae]|uniref:TonB-linked SusC/RagA family outer membrane protein n=1 Tax=Microbacter margulisiae TaxID=1350067 RepID=A0A7W5DPS9_9PORP|nr:TonB-dependent receptor [Microbacter margulisiae]MBB3186555.1 TonB-linked SusC/RagA family outer membrane protein [Microbacter margulisiae]